jgi:putative NIF3 family GTP cyclohydrolase 1 type 2
MPNDPREAIERVLWANLLVEEGNSAYAAHLNADSVKRTAAALSVLSHTIEVTEAMRKAGIEAVFKGDEVDVVGVYRAMEAARVLPVNKE